MKLFQKKSPIPKQFVGDTYAPTGKFSFRVRLENGIWAPGCGWLDNREDAQSIADLHPFATGLAGKVVEVEEAEIVVSEKIG